MAARRPLSALALASLLGCHASPAPTERQATRSPLAALRSRTPEQVRREGNALLGSGSAYLREHAHNPVDWQPWGAEALARAVKLDRPIFLSIGYVSCHWCHVMEHEVFERDDVAAFLNAHFISIKIDREERPDLDAVYMDAVQALTGSGGWPMTLFLTPALRPFFGGTYLPHDRFLQAVQAGSEQFRADRKQVESNGAEVYARITASEAAEAAPALELSEIHALARSALADLDPDWGGFAGRTKFPTPIKWRFLNDAYRKWGDPQIARAERQLLDAMNAGGIHDQIGGGFFRYSTEPTWTVPHFEKMLYDNAQLAALYLQASAALSEPRYRAIGLDTLDFLLTDMVTESGAFGASFDADAAGREGSTYLFTPVEVSSVLGSVDGPLVEGLLGVTSAGNFEGSNVPTFRSASRSAPAELELWARSRPELLAARRRRVQPAFDSKQVSAWNGLAIGALALGYRASGEARFLIAAERAADAIWRMNRSAQGELARTVDGAHKGVSAVLDDYAFLAAGLIDLFQATGKSIHLERAISLATLALDHFGASEGGWYLTSDAAEEPLGRQLETYDGVEPSGASSLIEVLERLSALTGRDDFARAAEHALARYAGVIRHRGLDMAGFLDDGLLAQGPFYELVIAGVNPVLASTWNQLLPSWVVGVEVASSGPSNELARAMPTADGKRSPPGGALAYVCTHGACQRPTASPAELRQQLLRGWGR
jgi:uncharacterized protein YyaL (SSP411 family)